VGATTALGGAGGNATGGNGGNNGASGSATGGGITVDPSGKLVLKPRQGATPGSIEASAFDVITSNSATAGGFGNVGGGGSATAGTGPAGSGKATPGRFGFILFLRRSLGGGIAIFGTATGDNVSVSGNHAMVSPDISGTLLP